MKLLLLLLLSFLLFYAGTCCPALSGTYSVRNRTADTLTVSWKNKPMRLPVDTTILLSPGQTLTLFQYFDIGVVEHFTIQRELDTLTVAAKKGTYKKNTLIDSNWTLTKTGQYSGTVDALLEIKAEDIQ